MKSLAARVGWLEKRISSHAKAYLDPAEAREKITAFVDANGGRKPQESLASALARVMGVSLAELRDRMRGKQEA